MKPLFENIGGNTFKVTEHDETDMNNPEEKREVTIAKAILSYLVAYENENINEELCLSGIKKLAQELLRMHGVK